MKQRAPSDLRQMRPEEIAWVAGIVEGEGCITVRKRYVQPLINVNMTDVDIIQRLVEITGVGKVYGPYKGTNKPRWEWKVQRINDCIELAKALLPWMGERRTQQIHILLDKCEG